MNNPYCLIVDDHLLFSGSFKTVLLSFYPTAKIELINTLSQAKEKIANGHYSLLFLDIMLPDATQEDVMEFAIHCQNTLKGLKIVVVSSMLQTIMVKKFFASTKINAWISKNSSLSELKEALYKISIGEMYISKDINARLAQSMLFVSKDALTTKELEVLTHVARGFTVKKIAETLFISPFTVLAHRRNIMRKLKLHSAQELVKYAYDNKLV